MICFTQSAENFRKLPGEIDLPIRHSNSLKAVIPGTSSGQRLTNG